MSSNFFSSRLSPFRLLQLSLLKCFQIYPKILIINSPSLIWPLLQPWVKKSLALLPGEDLFRWIPSSAVTTSKIINFIFGVIFRSTLVDFTIFVLYQIFIGCWVLGAVLLFAHTIIIDSQHKDDQPIQESRLLRRLFPPYFNGLKISIKLFFAIFVFGLNIFFRVLLWQIFIGVLALIIINLWLSISGYHPSPTIDEILEFSRTMPAYVDFLSLCIFLAPAIPFAVKTAFFPFCIVAEDSSNSGGFQCSQDLVRGKWWKVFFAILFGISSLMVYQSLISSALSYLPSYFSASDFALEEIFWFLIFPFSVVYAALLFAELKRSKIAEIH